MHYWQSPLLPLLERDTYARASCARLIEPSRRHKLRARCSRCSRHRRRRRRLTVRCHRSRALNRRRHRIMLPAVRIGERSPRTPTPLALSRCAAHAVRIDARAREFTRR